MPERADTRDEGHTLARPGAVEQMTDERRGGGRRDRVDRRYFLQSVGIAAVLGTAASGSGEASEDDRSVVYGYGGVRETSTNVVKTSSTGEASTQEYGEYGYGGVA